MTQKRAKGKSWKIYFRKKINPQKTPPGIPDGAG